MTVKEQALHQAIEIAVSHYDCFYEHGGGKLDVLSISNIQLFDCKLYPSDGMDGSNLEKCTGAAVFFVCISILHLHLFRRQVSQSDAAHHDSGCGTGVTVGGSRKRNLFRNLRKCLNFLTEESTRRTILAEGPLRSGFLQD